MKKILIFGSGQSGSTLTSMLIGSHSKITNLGEVYNLLNVKKNYPNKICMDGIKFNKHPIWRNLISELKKNNIERIDSFYKNFFIKNKLLFRKNNKILCDLLFKFIPTENFVFTTKQIFRVKILFEDHYNRKNTKFIFLIRDPRAQINSVLKRRDQIIRKKNYFFKNEFFFFFRKSFSWFLNNLNSHLIYLHYRNKVNIKIVKYEDLTLNPSELLNDIMEFCELQYENSQLEYYSHKHPIFSGNNNLIRRKDKVSFRNDFLKLKNTYWFLSSLFNLFFLILYRYPLLKKKYEREYS